MTQELVARKIVETLKAQPVDFLEKVKGKPNTIEEVISAVLFKLFKELPNFTQEKKEEVLLHSAHASNFVNVIYLVEDLGVSVNIKDKNAWTPLCLAIKMGHLEMAQYLVSKGADLYYRNLRYRTPLMLAASEKNVEMVKFLIDAYGDKPKIVVNAQDEALATSLILLLTSSTSEECGKALPETKDEIQIAKMLLEAGAGSTVGVNLKDVNDFTAIMYAAVNNKLEIAKLLIHCGAKLNIDNKGYKGISIDNKHKLTPLMAAAMNGYLEMCKLLIESGANAKAKNKEGKMAIMLASENGFLEVAKYLEKPSGIKTE